MSLFKNPFSSKLTGGGCTHEFDIDCLTRYQRDVTSISPQLPDYSILTAKHVRTVNCEICESWFIIITFSCLTITSGKRTRIWWLKIGARRLTCRSVWVSMIMVMETVQPLREGSLWEKTYCEDFHQRLYHRQGLAISTRPMGSYWVMCGNKVFSKCCELLWDKVRAIAGTHHFRNPESR